MLIGRLTDRPIASAGIGVVGHIKIGEKRLGKNGKEYPAALDYFRVDAPEHFANQFRAAFGDKPDKIEITFLSNDVTHSCNLQYELRGSGGKLFAKGDGQTFAVYNVDRWVFLSLAEINEKYGSLDGFKAAAAEKCGSAKGWEMRLTMRFLIPKIKGLIAEWQLSTKGAASSITQIVSTFDRVLESADTVIMLPFDLTVSMATRDAHGEPKRYPVIQLIPNASLENLVLLKEMASKGLPTWQNGLLTEERILSLNQTGILAEERILLLNGKGGE